jgi:hypothetical protein
MLAKELLAGMARSYTPLLKNSGGVSQPTRSTSPVTSRSGCCLPGSAADS